MKSSTKSMLAACIALSFLAVSAEASRPPGNKGPGKPKPPATPCENIRKESAELGKKHSAKKEEMQKASSNKKSGLLKELRKIEAEQEPVFNRLQKCIKDGK